MSTSITITETIEQYGPYNPYHAGTIEWYCWNYGLREALSGNTRTINDPRLSDNFVEGYRYGLKILGVDVNSV